MNTASTSTGATSREILAASFATADGGARAAGAVGGAFPDRIANTAILYVRADGTLKFVESKDWGAGRGALLGGVVGLIAGPLGVLAGSGLGAAAAKLRDTGFNDDQLRALGSSLSPNSSAVVFELAVDAVAEAGQLLESLHPRQIVSVPLDHSIARMFTDSVETTAREQAAASGDAQ